MTTHETGYEEPINADSPDLSVVETPVHQNRFEDVVFELPTSKFTEPDGEFELNDEMRVNHVFRQLNYNFPELYPDRSERSKRSQRANSFLSQQVTISNPSMESNTEEAYKLPKTIKNSRKRVLGDEGLKVANAATLAELSLENHPTVQVLAQIKEQYGQQLGDKFIEDLTEEILKTSHWKTYKGYISAIVDELR